MNVIELLEIKKIEDSNLEKLDTFDTYNKEYISFAEVIYDSLICTTLISSEYYSKLDLSNHTQDELIIFSTNLAQYFVDYGPADYGEIHVSIEKLNKKKLINSDIVGEMYLIYSQFNKNIYVLRDYIIDTSINERVFLELFVKKAFIDKKYFGTKGQNECLGKYEDNFWSTLYYFH